MKSTGWWRRLRSWFRPLRLQYLDSQVTPGLYLSYRNGKLRLESPTANYSHGELHQVFAEVWETLNLARWPIQRALILGFGAGSVWQLLRRSHPQAQITGVELDPAVLQVVQQHWAEIAENLQTHLIHNDALDYASSTTEQFQLVVVDVFVDRDVPQALTSETAFAAIWDRVAPGGALLWNWVTDIPARKANSQRLGVWLASRTNQARCLDWNLNQVWWAVKDGGP